jgi:hypothetical protein
MAFRFPRWSNTAVRLAVAGGLAGACAVVAAPMIAVRTAYLTGQDLPVDQPVELDHRHHVQDGGIECLYCHPTATTGAAAGIPATEVCMGCHSQIWPTSPLLEPVRRSWLSGRPIRWNRVHALPDFVYFHHGIHVGRAGIGCPTCPGRVDRAARVAKVVPMTMGWCLDCHRDPARRLGPGKGLRALTHCTACHR